MNSTKFSVEEVFVNSKVSNHITGEQMQKLNNFFSQNDVKVNFLNINVNIFKSKKFISKDIEPSAPPDYEHSF